MDEYREILYKKASSSLPNWPKGPNDFYVAILSHEKHVRSCEHKDLLWLKVRGKHTVKQVRAFHNKRVGRKVLFYDGRSLVPDDTQIRYLNHHRGDVVVFWTKRDDGRAPLAGISSTAVNSRPYYETSAMRSMRVDSKSPPPSAPPSKHVLEELNRGLNSITSKNIDSAFKVETGPKLYKVLCSDCPHWSNYCPLQASTGRIAATVHIVERHAETDKHKDLIRKKLDAIKAIQDKLPELCDRYPGSQLEVKVQPFGLGTPWITCAVCPTWVHKTYAGESLAMTVANGEKHLKSAAHANAFDTIMEDAADRDINEAEHKADIDKDDQDDSNISEPNSETDYGLSDSDGMDVDDPASTFPPHPSSKLNVIDDETLYCIACSEPIANNPGFSAQERLASAESHLASATHHSAYLSKIMSDKANALEDSSVDRGSIGSLKRLIEQYVQDYPLSNMEFKPSGKDIQTLQCMVCKGAGFHKYQFRNTLDAFASASLRKAAQHLKTKEHLAAAETAASGTSVVDQLKEVMNELASKHGACLGIQSKPSGDFTMTCRYCPTWSHTHRTSQAYPALSITATKEAAKSHLSGSGLHYSNVTAYDPPEVQHTKPKFTELQLAGVVRKAYPTLASDIEHSFRSITKHKIVCAECEKFFDNVYNGKYTKDTIFRPLKHVKAHGMVPHLRIKLSDLCTPTSTCRFKVEMSGFAVSITCSSCPPFAFSVVPGSLKEGVEVAKAHVESKKKLCLAAADSSKRIASEPHLAASSKDTAGTQNLQAIIDDLCKKHSPGTSFEVKYIPLFMSRKCEMRCKDCPEWIFGPATMSSDDTYHFRGFRVMAKNHLQSQGHRAALRTKMHPDAAHRGLQTSQSLQAAFKSTSTSKSAESSATKGLDLTSSASLVTLGSRVQASYPLMAAEVENAFKWFQRGQDAECVMCNNFFAHVINTNYTPASIKPPLFHVRAHTRVRATSQKLSELTAKNLGSVLIAELNGFTTEIICKQCPEFRFVVNDNLSKNLDGAMSAARNHLDDPNHKARVRVTNAGMPSSSTPRQRPDSDEQSPEAALFDACQEHFPGHASDIRKAFVKYTNGDIDCGECEAAFEQISALADDEAWVQHILDHMLGSSSRAGSSAAADEISDVDVDEDETIPKTSTAKSDPPATLPPKKQPSSIPGTRTADSLDLTPLRLNYPSSSFSMQRNERNEECFTCHDCSRTLSSGACMRNFEQHLGSLAHRGMVKRKGK